MRDKHIFTIIMDTYNRPFWLKEAVDAILRQTYENLEIILINNGATAETIEYLHEIDSRDARVKLVHFEDNQWRPEDPLRVVDVCFNAGLAEANGDYIFYQSDDDWMDDEYAEKMVKLFIDDSECITAAGLPVPVDANSNIINKGPRKTNLRSRYMSGYEMSLNTLRGGNMFSAPGSIFTIRTDVLRSMGGFHRNLEKSHLYGIVPFGTTGFDETARFYWRRHDSQLNVLLAESGKVWLNDLDVWLNEWEIQKRWQIFGSDVAQELVTTLQEIQLRSTAIWFVSNFFHGRLRTCKSMLEQILCTDYMLRFLIKLPAGVWYRRHDLLFLFRILKKKLYGIFLLD